MMHWINLALLLIVRSCLSDDGHEMEEFLKREYSLSKPYQGSNAVNLTGSMSGSNVRACPASLAYSLTNKVCNLLPKCFIYSFIYCVSMFV